MRWRRRLFPCVVGRTFESGTRYLVAVPRRAHRPDSVGVRAPVHWPSRNAGRDPFQGTSSRPNPAHHAANLEAAWVQSGAPRQASTTIVPRKVEWRAWLVLLRGEFGQP